MVLGRTTRKAVIGRLLGRLRYPQVFTVLAGLLLLDLFLPDPIPLIDEVVLALLTLLVGMWKRRDPQPEMGPKPPMKNVTPSD